MARRRERTSERRAGQIATKLQLAAYQASHGMQVCISKVAIAALSTCRPSFSLMLPTLATTSSTPLISPNDWQAPTERWPVLSVALLLALAQHPPGQLPPMPSHLKRWPGSAAGTRCSESAPKSAKLSSSERAGRNGRGRCRLPLHNDLTFFSS